MSTYWFHVRRKSASLSEQIYGEIDLPSRNQPGLQEKGSKESAT
jgi:hypothetical protein